MQAQVLRRFTNDMKVQRLAAPKKPCVDRGMPHIDKVVKNGQTMRNRWFILISIQAFKWTHRCQPFVGRVEGTIGKRVFKENSSFTLGVWRSVLQPSSALKTFLWKCYSFWHVGSRSQELSQWQEKAHSDKIKVICVSAKCWQPAREPLQMEWWIVHKGILPKCPKIAVLWK